MANELTKTEIKEIKIEQGKIDDLTSQLANEFEIIENSFLTQTNTVLFKHSINGNFEEWKKKQKIVRVQLQKDLEISKKNCQKLVEKSLDNTLIQVNSAITNISRVRTEKIDRVNLKAIANKGISLASDEALKQFDKSVAKVYKLRNQEPLFDAILKQTQEGIENGLKIVYKNGRLVSFKSYMEMNVRTTTRQEANEYLFNASKSNKVVFYICSSFGDCADDHKDFQGKYYYDNDWTSFGYDEETTKKIKSTISSYKMKSYQSVVNNAPYLTTRPNCRHTLRPVVLDDIFDNTPNELLKNNAYKGMKKGTYHDNNYKALQQQRYNERNIRKYKTRLEQHKLAYEQNPNPKLKSLIAKDKELINYWESEQDSLISKHKFLKRDRRREDNKILVQDLGAGYSLGLKIDGKNMFVKEIEDINVTEKDLPENLNKLKNIIIEKSKNIEDKNVKIILKNIGNILKNTNVEKYKYFKNYLYNPDYDSIILADEIVSDNEILFHELSHAIDWNIAKIINGEEGKYDIMNPYNGKSLTEGKVKNKTFYDLSLKFQDELNNAEKIKIKDLKELKLSRAMQDIVDSITKGEAIENGYIEYGHGKDYYSLDEQRKVEIFANFMTMKINGDKKGLIFFKENYEQLYRVQNEYLKEISKLFLKKH